MQLKNVPAIGGEAEVEEAPTPVFDPAELDNRAAQGGPKDDDEEDEEDDGPVMRDFEIRSIEIDEKNVNAVVRETIEIPPIGDDDKSRSVPTDFTIKGKNAAHQELKDALLFMRKPAFDAADVKLTTVEKHKFSVKSVQISGRLEDQTAKVSVTLLKELPNSKKPAIFKVQGIAIFALTPEQRKVWVDGLNTLFKEYWVYFDGKHRKGIQLGVFIQ